MVICTLKALIFLAGLGSSFSETWSNNFILNLALLFLSTEVLKCEPRCVWCHHHRISWDKVKSVGNRIIIKSLNILGWKGP